VEGDTFKFFNPVPENLSLKQYCPNCHDQTIVPALDEYNAILERAREVHIFFTADPSPPRLLKRSKREIKIEDCADRDETILRLGFCAAQLKFNAVIYVSVTAKQIRNHAHQKSSWTGTGLPGLIDEEKLLRQMR